MRYLLLVVAVVMIGMFGASYLLFNMGKETTEKTTEETTKSQLTGPNIFDQVICTSLLPATISSSSTQEYFTSYHIDGSAGESVKWISSQQHSEKITFFEPPIFFVVSDKFEGCGYIQETTREKIPFILEAFKDSLYTCEGKQIFIVQKTYESYTQTDLYLYESEEKMAKSTRFTIPEFSKIENFLAALGCEV